MIETEQAQFDPAVATMMDFRVPQHNDTRFVYVMPFDARKALVEFTVFGSQVLPDDDYRAELRSYLSRILKLDEYQIHEEESGVIPMTEAQFPARMSEHVINIGTAGGSTKPSTGYTFLRIQQQAGHIASALQRTGQPEAQAHASRFKLYDSIFLNVLDKNRRSGKRVFTDLYQRNPAWRIFKFLDEQTTLTEDLRIMSSTHLPTFTRAAFDIFTRPLK